MLEVDIINFTGPGMQKRRCHGSAFIIAIKG